MENSENQYRQEHSCLQKTLISFNFSPKVSVLLKTHPSLICGEKRKSINSVIASLHFFNAFKYCNIIANTVKRISENSI